MRQLRHLQETHCPSFLQPVLRVCHFFRFDAEDWEKRKDEAMLKCNMAKYFQDKKCGDFLLSLGSRPIVERAADRIWGDGGDGTGENRLGKILMVVRDALQKHRDEVEAEERKKRSAIDGAVGAGAGAGASAGK